MSYSIQAIRQSGKWYGVFDDLARSFKLALQSLGIYSPDGQPIIFGANLILSQPVSIPDNAIIFNLEQVTASNWLRGAYLDLLKSHEVWDYSQVNIRELAKHDIQARLVRIGWMEKNTIPDNHHKDIDVLFYGSMSDRRKRALQSIADTGLHVQVLSGVYGKERDAFIARSKVVVNIHYYDGGILEPVRLSYLVGNGITVVSESGADKQLDNDFFESVFFSSYDELAIICNGVRQLQSSILAKTQKAFLPYKLRQDILLKEALCLK